MLFQYRYVNFGTNFIREEGVRTDIKQGSPATLFDNEIALDVGGVCLGYNSCEDSIIDHHFHRTDGGQYPSATAAVLHLAQKISSKLANLPSNQVIWLVSHVTPDFDSFASMYLVRKLLEGVLPKDGWGDLGILEDGWRPGPSNIDWLDSACVAGLTSDPNRRWALLVALNAVFVDNCLSFKCPRNRTIHSILYASSCRGRKLEMEGAYSLMEEVRAELMRTDCDLNPITDSVLEGTIRFSPELRLLDQQIDAYESDIRRAKKCIVSVAHENVPFKDWYDKIKDRPLLDSNDTEPFENVVTSASRTQMDGVFLRDPECILFKEWARLDRKNSSMKQGFLFTAIAYSRGRPNGLLNNSDYWFSLDPERTSGMHLFDVWTALQKAEVNAIQNHPAVTMGAPRKGYEGRAGNPLQQSYECFVDPWFDAPNYECGLIATPNVGSMIGPAGVLDDLTDDPIVTVASKILLFAWFRSSVKIVDIPAAGSGNGQPTEYVVSITSPLDAIPPLPQNSFRFCSISISDDIEIFSGNLAIQLGRTLWTMLAPQYKNDIPRNFEEKYLNLSTHSVRVWNRDGVAVAYKTADAEYCELIRRQFMTVADLSRRFSSHCEHVRSKQNDQATLLEGELLLREMVECKQKLMSTEMSGLRSFFHARGLDESMATLSDLNDHSASRQYLYTIASVQKVIHVIEYILVPVYFAEMVHFLTEGSHVTESDHGFLHSMAGKFFVLIVGVLLVDFINWLVGAEPILIGKNSLLTHRLIQRKSRQLKE